MKKKMSMKPEVIPKQNEMKAEGDLTDQEIIEEALKDTEKLREGEVPFPELKPSERRIAVSVFYLTSKTRDDIKRALSYRYSLRLHDARKRLRIREAVEKYKRERPLRRFFLPKLVLRELWAGKKCLACEGGECLVPDPE